MKDIYHLETTPVKNLEISWKGHIASGNAHYEQADYKYALEDYNKAFEEASRLIRREEDCRAEGIPSTPIYLITCANVGNTIIHHGCPHEADEWFLRALKFASLKVSLSESEDTETSISQSADVRMAMWNYTDSCERTQRPIDKARIQDALIVGAEAGANTDRTRS